MTAKTFLDTVKDLMKRNPKGRRYDDAGRYYPDPTPIAPPVGYKRSPTIAEQIRTMVRSEALRQHADREGMDTFEEADDLDIGDDYDPRSPWEEQFEGEFDLPLTNQKPVPVPADDRNPPTPPQPSEVPPAERAKPAVPQETPGPGLTPGPK